ncbi:MAG: DUF2019 domain-containing protein [Myxococcota bacterium]
MTIDPLIAAYREAATIHGDALEVGDAPRCNAALDEVERIRAELRDTDPDYTHKILALLDDSNCAVRSCAAVDALDFAPEEGLRVLREVAAGPLGMVQFGAEMMLEKWAAQCATEE